jgi:L-histidine N-alpha-methyltransferase
MPDLSLAVDVHLRPDDLRAALERDVVRGLTAAPKQLPPVWFYDERGSHLFDEITRLPEYYLTRCEREILRAHAGEIAERSKADTLIDLGSGTSEKTLLLLSALDGAGTLARFVPFDVSEEFLREAAAEIAKRHDGIHVHAVVGDFEHHLDRLPGGGRRLVAFLGSTIGNLDPAQRHRFLTTLRAGMTSADHLLLGTDLVKDPARLVAAYDDRAGVTADFNRNVLRVLNARLGASFDPDAFDHVAVWNAEAEWVEMRLRSRVLQIVPIRDLDVEIGFAEGEELRTEISAKFRPEGVAAELAAAGFAIDASWTDAGGDFRLTLATVAG